ncbi:MAG: prepilin-type cleavage/methylation domain-containing protein [Gallionella sp.]
MHAFNFSVTATCKPESSQHGVVLLEALVAILIFSMGVLALVGLQAAMMKNTSDSKFRSEASLIAQQRIGMMWADPAKTALGGFNENNTDISALLPRGTRTVTQNAANQFQISITWWPAGEPQQHNFKTMAYIDL